MIYKRLLQILIMDISFSSCSAQMQVGIQKTVVAAVGVRPARPMV